MGGRSRGLFLASGTAQAGVILYLTDGALGTDQMAVALAASSHTNEINLLVGQPVPEPTTLALLGAGLVALGARRRRSS